MRRQDTRRSSTGWAGLVRLRRRLRRPQGLFEHAALVAIDFAIAVGVERGFDGGTLGRVEAAVTVAVEALQHGAFEHFAFLTARTLLALLTALALMSLLAMLAAFAVLAAFAIFTVASGRDLSVAASRSVRCVVVGFIARLVAQRG